MQLSTFFTAFCTFLVIALTADHVAVTARPSPFKRSAGVKMPLRRMADPVDIHPEILHQHRHYHMQKRYARMTGGEGPSDEDIATGIEQRAADIQRRLDAGDVGFTPASSPTAANSVSLSLDAVYIALMAIGTPPVNYRVIVDTGSSDFWIKGEGCKSTQGGNCGDASITLGPSSSSSFTNLGTPWSVGYLTGFASGTVVADTLTIAGFTMPNVQFGVATVVDSGFTDSDSDGLMGFGDSDANTQNVPVPLVLLRQQGLIENAVFALRLTRPSDPNESELTVGASDPAQYDTSTLVTVNQVLGSGHWVAPMDAVIVNGVDLGLTQRTAILDSGTSFIAVPEQDLLTIIRQIPGAQILSDGSTSIPCDSNPSLALTFGGRSFPLQTQDVILQFPNGGPGMCAGSISQAADGDGSSWLVGWPFLNNVYTIYDFDHATIGIADLVN